MGRKEDGWVKSPEKRAKEKQLKVQYARNSDVIAYVKVLGLISKPDHKSRKNFEI